MGVIQKVRDFFGGRKSSDIAFLPTWKRTTFPDIDFDRLTNEGYKRNAAVSICATRLALSYQQPHPFIRTPDGDPLPTHPLSAVLGRPNPDMSWPELAIFIAMYKAIGGNCYLKKVRGGSGRTVELWPYHIGQMRPVPGRFDWVDGYEYNVGDGRWTSVEKEAIIHLKWPVPDPAQPWIALGAIRAIAREVDTDNEATRYQYALLANDAVAQTIIHSKAIMGDTAFKRFQQQWYARHGGDNRGGIAIVEGVDGGIERLSLNLEEMAFDTLRKVPEARISSGFLIPPEYSGLTVGQEHSTYNNKSEARRAFFEDSILPLCDMDAGELTHGLEGELRGAVIAYDYTHIAALQENETDRVRRAAIMWEKGLATRNEARVYLGLPRVEDLKLAPNTPELPPGDAFKTNEPKPGAPPPTVIDVLPAEPPLLEDESAKRRAFKARPSLATIERRIEKAMQAYLEGQYRRAAEAVGDEHE